MEKSMCTIFHPRTCEGEESRVRTQSTRVRKEILTGEKAKPEFDTGISIPERLKAIYRNVHTSQ